MRIIYAVFTISVMCVILTRQQLFAYYVFRLNEIRPILFSAEAFVVMSTTEKRLPPANTADVSRTAVSSGEKFTRQEVDRQRWETKTENCKNECDVYETIIAKHYDINPQLWRRRSQGQTEMLSLIVFLPALYC